MRLWLPLAFVVGLALGAGGALLAPRWVSPYLPQAIGVKTEPVEGEVTRKLNEEDRLLLTIVTAEGSILATFKKKIQEIDLLVEEGDLMTLALRRYEPFVHDPLIERVRKGKPMGREGEEPPPSPRKDKGQESPASQ